MFKFLKTQNSTGTLVIVEGALLFIGAYLAFTTLEIILRLVMVGFTLLHGAGTSITSQ